MPLVNILAAGVFNTSAVLEIADATGHMAAGGKKDALYLAGLVNKHIDYFESIKPGICDLLIYDGASNVQKSGKVTEAKYPRMTTVHGAEHVIALFFRDLFNLPEIAPLVDVHRLFCNGFGGSRHKPHAMFIKESMKHNGGRKVGLLRVSEVRMAGYAIAWLRNLRMKPVLQSVVMSPEFLQDTEIKVSFRLIVVLSSSATNLLFSCPMI